MKTFVVLALALSLPLAACSSSAPSGTDNQASSGKSPDSAAKPTEETKPAAPAKAAFVQKGIPDGKVVVGYVQDNADPGQCAAIVDAPAKKADFAKNADKVAEMMKGKIVPACPTDNVVGTCNAGMGMIVNYSGPKYTTESAKKDCTSHPHAKWIE